jgi:hypothetical protein
MLGQIQGLQAFVTNHLSDVIDWRKHVAPDPTHKPTGDVAHILITTPFNRYKMSIGTAYAEPPAGAPVACRSLGWMGFDDPADNKHVLGPKSDMLYSEISKHVCVRELTDALAAARREVAEASAEMAGPARVRLTELAAKAKKYGIEAKVPDGALAAAVQPPQAPQTAVPNNPAPMSTGGPATVAAPAAGKPWIGCPVIFITNPGEQIAGMQEIPGHIVRIQPDGRICIFLTADNSEPIYRDNLSQRGTPAGNGRVHQFNCWDFNPEFERDRSRLRHLEEAIGKMADEGNQALQAIADLRQAVADLTARAPAGENSEPPSAKAQDKAKKPTAAA